MRICVAHNVASGKEQYWIKAIQKKGISYDLLDLTEHDWLDKIIEGQYDLIIAIPHGTLSQQKQLFDERVYVIKHILRLPLYPNFEALLVYENKRMLSYWLKANKIPHPETKVFYRYEEALHYLDSAEFPLVAKSNIGAAGSGVHILKNRSQALGIVKKTFKGSGFPRRKGPNLNTPNAGKRILSKITNLEYISKKIKSYHSIHKDKNTTDILFQEYIPHTYEWKNIRIGDSFFSHKKMVQNNYASGTGIKTFDDPPESLLNFIKKITDKTGFNSVSVDVFEVEKEKYLVNEVQTYFGQPLPYLMKIDDKTGRYLFRNGKWIFEEGDFNQNLSCDLRLDHAMTLLTENKL